MVTFLHNLLEVETELPYLNTKKEELNCKINFYRGKLSNMDKGMRISTEHHIQEWTEELKVINSYIKTIESARLKAWN